MKESKILKIKEIHDVIHADFLQNVQDFFAKTMGVALQVFANQKPITNPSNFSQFCIKYNKSDVQNCKKCCNCHHKWEREAVKKNCTVIYKCHMGLTSFAIPVKVKNNNVAYLLGGQVFTDVPHEKYFKKIVKKLNSDSDEYEDEIKNIKIISDEKINAITNMLSVAINSLVEISYANFELSKLRLEYIIPKNIPIEEWFFLNCNKVNRPITAREFEVLKLIVLGKSNAEIAKELFISVHTAKAHVSSILEKFLVDDRVQVAVKAVREGII